MGPEAAIIAPAVASAAAPAAAGVAASTIPAWLSAAGQGALLGGLGSLIMGGDPMQGALLGGLGGGIGSATGITDSLGSLFGGGVNPDVASTGAALGQQSASGLIDLPWTGVNEAVPSFIGLMAPPVASGGGIGNLIDLPWTGVNEAVPSFIGPMPPPVASGGGIGNLIDLPWTGVNEAVPSFIGLMPPPVASGGGIGNLIDLPWTGVNEQSQSMSGATQSTPAQTGGGFWDSKLGKMVPYAGIGAAAMLADNMMAPKQVGPQMRKELKSGNVRPMEREYTEVDPYSFLGIGGNRQFFNNSNPAVQFYVKGGKAEFPDKSRRRQHEEDAMSTRAKMDRHPMVNTVDFTLGRFLDNRNYPGSYSEYMRDEYGDVPITREIMKVKKYANGGSSSASSMNIPEMGIGRNRKVKGAGDGMNDKIPAMLSDGEFVISAPVVSALGNGSNDAGARKLDSLQKKVLKGHYKGGKPRKSAGIGSYVY